MTSSLFARRPRIQPLPKICRAAPSHSCYDPPIEFPDPVGIQVFCTDPPEQEPPIFSWTCHGLLWRDYDFFYTIKLPTSAGGSLAESFEYQHIDRRGVLHLSTTGHGGIPPDWEHGFDLLVPPFPWSWSDTFIVEDPDERYLTIEMWG